LGTPAPAGPRGVEDARVRARAGARHGGMAGDHARPRRARRRHPARRRRRKAHLGRGRRQPRCLEGRLGTGRRRARIAPRGPVPRQRHRRAPRGRGRPHAACCRLTIGVNVVTRIDSVEPLELPALRDVARERAPWSARALLTAVIGVAVTAVAAWAATLATRAALGPGRVLAAVLVGIWCAAAALVAHRRPREPLAAVMLAGAAAGALAMLGAAALARDHGSDAPAPARAAGLALLPAVGLQLVAGLPDGGLRTTARRAVVGVGYLGAVAVAVVLYGDRPVLHLGALLGLACAAALVGLGAF